MAVRLVSSGGALTGESEEEAVKLGWAHGALVSDDVSRRHNDGNIGPSLGSSPMAAQPAFKGESKRTPGH
jgi:hypothetical protein